MTEPSVVQQRIDLLPRKLRLAFADLLACGYLSEQLMETILDAGEIAEDNSKLLGFAIGYLNLRESGVPMRDVIRMSKDLGRKIRLDWSIPRWRNEHERLSRAETLLRLSEDNVFYDLSKFEPYIPSDFPGYLIRTSRRLGMEGLRQRHCVASYHRQLERGYCAIASVFANGKRWTVQLSLTEKPDCPIRISQIRGRLNSVPSSCERSAIYAAFDVDELSPSDRVGPRPSRPQLRHVYQDNLRRVLPLLREHNVSEVRVDFDGSGDSGCIDDVRYDAADFDPSRVSVLVIGTDHTFQDGQWVCV